MHTLPLRQLFLAVLCLGFTLSGTGADVPKGTAAQDLQALQLLEASVRGRGATEPELEKLGTLLDGLVAKYPLDASVRNARAEFFWDRDEQAKAKGDWLDAERLDPRNPVVLNHLGGCLLEEGAAQPSAEYFTRAVLASPKTAAYHFNLANVQFMFRKQLPTAAEPRPDEMLQSALGHYAEAAKLAPLSEEYLRGLAEAFLIQPTPDWQSALGAWERLERIAAHKDFALANLARIHLKLGEKEKALECLAKIESPEFTKMKEKLSVEARGGEAAAVKSGKD